MNDNDVDAITPVPIRIANNTVTHNTAATQSTSAAVHTASDRGEEEQRSHATSRWLCCSCDSDKEVDVNSKVSALTGSKSQETSSKSKLPSGIGIKSAGKGLQDLPPSKRGPSKTSAAILVDRTMVQSSSKDSTRQPHDTTMSGSNSAVSTHRGNNEMTVTTPDKALGAEDGLTDYKEDDIGMKENREERFERVKDARSR